MRRVFVWFSLFAVLAVAGFLFQSTHWRDYLIRHFISRSVDHGSRTQAHTEEQWLVDQICRDVAEMIYFAKNGSTAKTHNLKVQVESRARGSFDVQVESGAASVRENIALQRHLWSEDNYKPFAAALLSAWNVPKSSASGRDDADLLDQLANGGMATLIYESKQTSESLTQSPLDPSLNERAAFIIGCFALHEASGSFSDVRPALNRMTAHLALAGTQKHEASNCGEIARVILSMLSGRQAEAFAKIRALPPSLDGWAKTLEMRTTGDWRVLENPEKASRLQQLEYFRTLRQRGLCPKSRAFLTKIQGDQSPDWIRIALEDRLSVQEGHAFAGGSVPSEVQSTLEDYQSFFSDTLSRSQFIAVLDQPPTRCLTKARDGKLELEVLSWGAIAAFHQRHLCQAAVSTEYFLAQSWGVREEAKKFRDNAERFFGRMTMFPLARQFFSTEKQAEQSATEQAVAFTSDHPELVTAAVWSRMGPVIATTGERGLPHQAISWFADFPVFGTTYDFPSRYQHFRNGRNPESLHSCVMLSPFEHDIIAADVQVRHEPPEEVAFSYMAVKDFDVRAMWQVAEAFKNQPQMYDKMLEPLCELHPDYFLILGQFYVDHKMSAAAAVAYRNAFERAEDRVYMANSSRWIVDYYFDNGRIDDALKIATDAAEVYSHAGLCTMGHLMERMKRYTEAERYYKRVRERYEDPAVLNAFYQRNRNNVPEYTRRSDELRASAFPRGLENAQLQDFKTTPHDGVSIASSNSLVHDAHLKEGDVIVAINNVRVHSENQYIFVRDMDADSSMTLIVWNGSAYSERKVNVPNRRLYCKLANYRAR